MSSLHDKMWVSLTISVPDDHIVLDDWGFWKRIKVGLLHNLTYWKVNKTLLYWQNPIWLRKEKCLMCKNPLYEPRSICKKCADANPRYCKCVWCTKPPVSPTPMKKEGA